MAVKAYAIVNGEKYYNRILIEESEVDSYVYFEDPDAILVEDEEGVYSFRETESMKNSDNVIDIDPLSMLTIEQKKKIAEILNL
jgi:hypothetical protein